MAADEHLHRESAELLIMSERRDLKIASRPFYFVSKRLQNSANPNSQDLGQNAESASFSQ